MFRVRVLDGNGGITTVNRVSGRIPEKASQRQYFKQWVKGETYETKQ